MQRNLGLHNILCQRLFFHILFAFNSASNDTAKQLLENTRFNGKQEMNKQVHAYNYYYYHNIKN